MAGVSDVKRIYKEVVNEVCNAVREALSEEGFDDHTLQELRQMWSTRLEASKALEPVQTSAVDEATTRNNRRTTTNESNQHTTIPNKQINPQRTGTIQSGLVNPLTNSNMTFTTSSNQNSINSANIAHINPQFQRSTQPIRAQFNPTTMGNNPMKTNQLDGAADEVQPTKSSSKRPKKKKQRIEISLQVDGTGPTGSDDDDDDDDNEAEGNEGVDELDDEDDDEGNEEGKDDPNPLCSDDDVSDEEPAELFETDNVIVCQYEKISRTKNKWRFTLKSGVMNINGRDFVFSKATGDADW